MQIIYSIQANVDAIAMKKMILFALQKTGVIPISSGTQ
jgi:hypothetical protein